VSEIFVAKIIKSDNHAKMLRSVMLGVFFHVFLYILSHISFGLVSLGSAETNFG